MNTLAAIAMVWARAIPCLHAMSRRTVMMNRG
jgi:hypothetical protein